MGPPAYGSQMWDEHIIDAGTGVHEALLADRMDRGRPDMIGKPLHGPGKRNVHVRLHAGGDKS